MGCHVGQPYLGRRAGWLLKAEGGGICEITKHNAIFLLVFVRVSQDQDGQLLGVEETLKGTETLSEAYATIGAVLHVRAAEWKVTKLRGRPTPYSKISTQHVPSPLSFKPGRC